MISLPSPVLVLSLIAVLAFGSGVHAATITATYTSNVIMLGDGLVGPFSIGDKITAQYTWETTAPDAQPESNFGLYNLTSYWVTVGSSFLMTGNSGLITVSNNMGAGPGLLDSIALEGKSAGSVGTVLPGLTYYNTQFIGRTTKSGGSNVVTSDSIPSGPPNFSLFDSNEPWLSFQKASGAYTHVVGSTPVLQTTNPPAPVPGVPDSAGTVGLVLPILAALVGWRKRLV